MDTAYWRLIAAAFGAGLLIGATVIMVVAIRGKNRLTTLLHQVNKEREQAISDRDGLDRLQKLTDQSVSNATTNCIKLVEIHDYQGATELMGQMVYLLNRGVTDKALADASTSQSVL